MLMSTVLLSVYRNPSLYQEARYFVAERSTDLTEPLCRRTIESKEEEVETLCRRGGHGEEGEEEAQAAQQHLKQTRSQDADAPARDGEAAVHPQSANESFQVAICKGKNCLGG